jgi:hypothetical protein
MSSQRGNVDYAKVVDRLVDAVKELNRYGSCLDVPTPSAADAAAEHSAEAQGELPYNQYLHANPSGGDETHSRRVRDLAVSKYNAYVRVKNLFPTYDLKAIYPALFSPAGEPPENYTGKVDRHGPRQCRICGKTRYPVGSFEHSRYPNCGNCNHVLGV